MKGTHLYTWAERGTVRVKYIDQEHNTMSQPKFEPGPLDQEAIEFKNPEFRKGIIALFGRKCDYE